ncbi:MAG: autotransporter domain-containing protein [Sedimentisphaerales bacterium]|nr:autotransporter domain-containing protein [Sedimentisphaerales bacterium]
MWNGGKMDQSAACLAGRQQILAVLVILGSMCAVVGAQIDVNETGLHGGQGVYGLTASLTPDPNVNAQDITVFAWGETDPSLYANVWFNAYGIGANVNLVNTGDVGVTATGGNANADGQGVDTNARVVAYGILNAQGQITNSGRINVDASGGTASALSNDPMREASATGWAYGLSAQNGGVDNSGTVTVTAYGGHALADGDVNTAATTYGIYALHGGVTNNANITATAVGGTAETGNRATAGATARGIYTDGNVNNTGNLAVVSLGGTATTDGRSGTANLTNYADTEGIYTLGTLNNSGNVTTIATSGGADDTGPVAQYQGADTRATARGLIAEDGMNNTGNVLAVATGGTATSQNNASADASATGLRTFGDVTNSGNVIVMATGGAATGSDASSQAQAYGVNGYDLNNTGALTVVATGGTATGSASARTHSYAEGLSGGPVNNSGALSVTATAGTAASDNGLGDAHAVGITAGDNVTNSGNITVAATAMGNSAETAYGIRMNSFGNLTNTGIIRATADTAYELYVASNTTWLVDRYNVTLDGDPSQGSLAVAEGARLALNNARLTVTGITGETLWDTPYQLFTTEGTGVIDGNFVGVQAVNPNTSVTYYDQGTAASADDTVALAYTPVASSALASTDVERQVVSQATDVINNYMGATVLQNVLSLPSSGLLASAGSTAESLGLAGTASGEVTGAFVQPFYSQVDNDARPLGYNVDVWGVTAGVQQIVETTLLNLHIGYRWADIEYTGSGYSANRENQDLVIGGLDGLTRWEPWTLRYGISGFHGWHEYEGLTGMALEEEEAASYRSYGVVATLLAGHIFQWGAHALLPEAGVNWLWVHRDEHISEATDPSWDTAYSATNDYDLHGVAALRWLSSFMCGDMRVSPSASVGVRHLLSDDESDVWQSVEGATPVLVEASRDRTAMTASGSLVLGKAPHALSVAYDGSYSPDTQRHSVWLRYSYQF